MNHLGTKMLETQRLILRRFTAADAGDMFRNWAGDAQVTKYMTWQTHQSEETSAAYAAMLAETYAQENKYEWAIELRELGQAIGSIGVVHCNDGIESVEIGYCLGRPWWNQGIMSEAFSAVIRFMMEEVGVNRVCARFDPRNVYSGKVMEKCGLSYEGTQRAADKNNQGICDVSWYALLRKDYTGR